MRAIVVADIHANLDALNVVLVDAESGGAIDAVWCLGDVVGYGAEPDACIERLTSYPLEAIAGNHDLAAIGAIGTAEFNPYAAFAVRWTGEHLSDESKAWLASLPRVAVTAQEFTLTHGSLADPVWEYLVYPEAAEMHLKLQTTPYGFVGHSHLPLVFRDGGAGVRPGSGATLSLDGERFVANPGSVGQPRDGDPRAAWLELDTDSWEVTYHRTEYEIDRAADAIAASELPEHLAKRLYVGQ
jgi:predicted phosphodiesterase